MVKTFQYRIYPTPAQAKALQGTLDAARWVYNQTLEVRRDAWQERKESLSLYDTNKLLTGWKVENEWLKQAYSHVLQNAQMRVDLAFKAFFRRVKAGEKPGYPRFRGRDRYDSFTFKGPGFKLLDNGKLRISKVGDVRIKLHRPINGKVKTLTIKRNALGYWYASFSVEVEAKSLPESPRVVGVDVGLSHFATLSDGSQVDNPRFFRHDERALVKAQKRLSAATKGTPERRKAKRVVQHIHQRIANRRKDFAHKLSRRWVNEYQFIAFEKLDIKDMQDGNYRGMNKSIGDAAWRQLFDYTTYKAAEAGRTVVSVDPRNTTQMCSGCGVIVRKSLGVRVHSCPNCGLVLDRDHNAALNILARGLSCIG
jgi:putative transposase